MAIIKKAEQVADRIGEVATTPVNTVVTEGGAPVHRRFFGLFEVLSKVKWPTWKQTMGWSLTVFLFTIILSLFLGFFDNIFNGLIGFAECTATLTKQEIPDKNFAECSADLGNTLIFRN